MSSTITYVAWGLAGAFFGFVTPLAFSSPYPTPSRPDWTIHKPATAAVAGTFSLASASAAPIVAEPVQTVALVNTVRTVSIRRPIGEAPEPEADAMIVTASLGGMPTRDSAEQPSPAAPLGSASKDDIDAYLWEVYQRQPTKKDRGGDFTWKDPAAAKRMGKTLQSYVIAGMDADFREQLYHAGKAMDAAGVEWTIVSGFRDDWRQSIASGIKARTGYSRHGGSRAVGGYGNGRAVDIGHIERSRSHEVFRWLDENGAKFALHRPYRHFDPPHVEPRIEWRRVASRLRRERTGATTVTETREQPEVKQPAAKRKTRNARVAQSRGRRQN